MQFEYDERKSESNLEKHGIDSEEAKSLWDDADMIEFSIECKGEDRWGVIAHYAGSCWIAICTTRRKNTRIISVRRATGKEASLYDRAKNDR